MIMNKRIVLLVVLLLLGQCMWAQSTRVKGKVTDAKTGEVLPLVNVFFYRDDYWNDHRLRWRILPRNPRRSD